MIVYEMVVGTVEERVNGSWDATFAPDNDTSITVWPELVVGGIAPKPGDFLKVRAPEVVGIERRSQ